MADTQPAVTRGALTGAVISAGFGLAWTVWGSSGVDGGWKIVAIVIGAAIAGFVIMSGLRMRGRAVADDESMFRSRPYQVIVVAELVALVAGSVALGTSGHNEYVPVWYATVVGIHFVAFGRVFWQGFIAIGAALLIAAGAGLVLGLNGGSDAAIAATTGLLAAAILLSAGSATVLRARKD